MERECKYKKKCDLYSEESSTCNVSGGKYTMDKYAGCYEYMKMKEEKE